MPPAKKRELKKGDMIEFLRGQFNHWAVYIGDGEVVHVTNTSVVKRETLETVAGNDLWQIDNSLDNKFELRPENDIVKDALARVGEEFPYNVRTNNCEHFATELRYGEPHSKQTQKPELKKGDMIEFLRGTFNHWAVYIGVDEVGDGEVVHVICESVGYSGASGQIWSSVTNKAMVKREKLESVAGIHEWRIKNYLDSTFPPQPQNDIVKDALARVGKEVEYNLIKNNCEHFATELRYGKKRSQQVRKVSWMGLITLGLVGGATIIWTPFAMIGAAVGASSASLVIINTDVSDVNGNKKKDE